MDRRAVLVSPAVVSLVVAVVYATLGLLTLALGQMTGLAAPVWPAAGVAFAAALQWRWRALPGIFLGSVAANAFWLTRLGEPEAGTWFTAVAVGIGAALGAAAGASLVRRFIGPVPRLDIPRSVILTLALGGLVATTVAPTVGVAAQLTTGILSTDKAAFGWLTWWVGDAIGTIVFAPLVLMLMPGRGGYWSGRRWKIAVPSLLISGILIAAVVQNVANERARIERAVAQLAVEADEALTRNIALHQEVLEGLRGLVEASDDVTAEEFTTYTDDMLGRFPNLQALSWNPLVTDSELEAFEARQRMQPGLQNFTVTERDGEGKLRPVSPRREYVAVAYIEPIANNRTALGFDINSDPARAVAIRTARDTGRPTATAPVDLVQESGTQKGMLALLPVYEGARDQESVPRAGLRGFAVGVYRLGNLLAETFRGPRWDSVGVTLVDVSGSEQPVVIADLPARNSASPDHVSAAPTATTLPLDVYGRSWELTVRPTSAAFTESRNGVMAILFLAVLAMTFMLETFLLVLSGMESLARRLTAALGGAARYVESILPRDVESPVPVSSRYIPSEQLGGDSFDHRWLDDDHLVVYVVDVSGHGIGPAVFSVSVHNLLRSGTLGQDMLRDPGRVLTELNRLFQQEKQAGNSFTIWYGVYQPSTRTLRYARAGHPPAIVLTGNGSGPAQLDSGSVPIGVLTDVTYETHEYRLDADADVLLYSDGAFELVLTGGARLTLDQFIDLCARTARSPQWTLDDLVGQLRDRSENGDFHDDCTLVRITIP
ncbi:CHASE domain-containing protein [Mycolicibacterium sp.]|uniref:CHASE domain-containing protein n=1 Tax=Mycolicibacterium sp. TaxID=2320850 RepID=UPI0028AFD971|nr:CHASE domain-containing protein [Mycolicibacterium sp.]